MLDGSSLVAAAPSSPTTESPPSTIPAHNTRAGRTPRHDADSAVNLTGLNDVWTGQRCGDDDETTTTAKTTVTAANTTTMTTTTTTITTTATTKATTVCVCARATTCTICVYPPPAGRGGLCAAVAVARRPCRRAYAAAAAADRWAGQRDLRGGDDPHPLDPPRIHHRRRL